MTDYEFRPFAEPVEVRSAGEGGHLVLSGVAIRYGARSKDLGGFRERIMPGAATESIQKGDIRALEEHRNERYLGRTGNASLRLIDTGTELRYEVDLPDTAVGRDVGAMAQRGDYRGSSFGFRAKDVTWSKDTDGVALRTITKFAMVRDVGPTVAPAYDTGATETVLRNFSDEAGVRVELRSVVEAAGAGRLAQLLDGEPLPLPGLLTLNEVREIEKAAEETPPPIHRRPAHWFI